MERGREGDRREEGGERGERGGREAREGREGEGLAETRLQPLPLPFQFPNTEPQSWEGGVQHECILTWAPLCKDWKPSTAMSSMVTIG